MPQSRYGVAIHEEEEGAYWSEVPSLTGAGPQGESISETVANANESIEAGPDTTEQRGEPASARNDLLVKVRVAASGSAGSGQVPRRERS